MSKLKSNLELLRRIDKKDYLTEREHREFLERLNKDLEVLEILKEWLVYDEYEKAIMTYRDTPKDLLEKIKGWLDA